MVINSWSINTFHIHDIDKWQEKWRRLRRHTKGWHINVEGAYRKEKKNLLSKLDMVDKKAESSKISFTEREDQVQMQPETEEIAQR